MDLVKPGGVVAFTDWVETGPMTDEEMTMLLTFMVFPYLETLDGYAALAETAGLTVDEKEDLSTDFSYYVQMYLDIVGDKHRQDIINGYGQEMYDEVVRGLTAWRDASTAGKVGRGCVIARKPA